MTYESHQILADVDAQSTKSSSPSIERGYLPALLANVSMRAFRQLIVMG